MGDLVFRELVRQEAKETDLVKLRSVLQDRPTGIEIVDCVAKMFSVKAKSITKKLKGPRIPNPARAFSMYVCQEYGNMSLKEIKKLFDLGHTGSASYSINKVRQEIRNEMWKRELKALEKSLYIVK